MKRHHVKEGQIEDPRALQIRMGTGIVPYTSAPHQYAHTKPCAVQVLPCATSAQVLHAFQIAEVLRVPVEVVVQS